MGKAKPRRPTSGTIKSIRSAKSAARQGDDSPASNRTKKVTRRTRVSSGKAITWEVARRELIDLREEVCAESPNVPRKHGLLRKSMLLFFIENHITDQRSFESKIPDYLLNKTASEQLTYLPRVFEITSRASKGGQAKK